MLIFHNNISPFSICLETLLKQYIITNYSSLIFRCYYIQYFLNEKIFKNENFINLFLTKYYYYSHNLKVTILFQYYIYYKRIKIDNFLMYIRFIF